MRELEPQLRARGVALACVVQAEAEELRETCGTGLRCIPDPGRETHRKLGLERMRLSGLLSPELRRRRQEAAAGGFSQLWRRTFARRSDAWLLPGALLVERGGRILWIHRGAHAADLPRPDELFAVATEHAPIVSP